MGSKASEKTRASKKNRELKRCARALRHAKKRGASEYVKRRIKHHMNCVEAGKTPTALPERKRYQEETQRAQIVAARRAYVPPIPAKPAQAAGA